MSYYYTYYVGYKKDNKLYPYGPYTSDGKLRPVRSVSRSFSSYLYQDFYDMAPEQISDELRKEFEYENFKGEKVVDVKWLPLKELPNESYIKTGYFLIKDVAQYEADEHKDTYDLFYDQLSPTVWAAKAQNELKFGKPAPQFDCEGEPFEVHSASEYMFYAYPDYYSEEYEAAVLRTAADALRDWCMPDDIEMVILETEG